MDNKQNRCSFKSKRLIKFSQILMKEHGMTTIDKRYYLIKTLWAKRIYKCILLDLTFGNISLQVVIKDINNKIKRTFIKCIDKCLKELKNHKDKHIYMKMTMMNN